MILPNFNAHSRARGVFRDGARELISARVANFLRQLKSYNTIKRRPTSSKITHSSPVFTSSVS
jgi:hypothetical protein